MRARVVIGIGLALHGLVHLLGVVAFWEVATVDQLPYTTALLDGRWDVGEAGPRIFGLGWLAAAVLFAVAGAALATRRSWWRPVILTGATLSVVLCVLAWPDAWAGLALDVVILAGLLLPTPRGHALGPRHGEAMR
jgi:hypothetical protein